MSMTVGATARIESAESPKTWLTEWPIAVVAVGIASSLIMVIAGEFRTGALVLGAAVAAAGLLRLVLPETQAGLLRSRSRRADLAVLLVLSAGMLATAFWVPPPG